MVKTFTLDTATAIGTLDLSKVPDDLVEALAATGALVHVMERPPGTYRIRQSPDLLGAVLQPVKAAGGPSRRRQRRARHLVAVA